MMDLDQFTRRYCRPSFVLVLMLYAVFIMLAFSVLDEQQLNVMEHEIMHRHHQQHDDKSTGNKSHAVRNNQHQDATTVRCRIQLVEGTPDALSSNPRPLFLTAFAVCSALIQSANHTIHIVRGSTPTPNPTRSAIASADSAAWQGRSLIAALHEAHHKRSVRVRIVQTPADAASASATNTTEFTRNSSRADELAILGAAVWIVDDHDAFVRATDGSETISADNLGLWLSGCPDVVGDLRRAVFMESDAANDAGEQRTPSRRVRWNSRGSFDPGWLTDTFFDRLPPSLVPPTLLDGATTPVAQTILAARRFVEIALLYESDAPPLLWPAIEEALRTMAVERPGNVSVRLLVSYDGMYDRASTSFKQHFLLKLTQLKLEWPGWDVQFKRFAQAQRLNRNQFLCTDNAAYVMLAPDVPNRLHGLVLSDADHTSNDRPLATKSESVRAQLHRMFAVYWGSRHAKPVQTVLRREIIRVGHSSG